MKKNRLVFLSIASLLVLSACGGSQDSGATSSSSEEASTTSESTPSEEQPSSSSEEEENCVIKEDTTITIWTTYNDTYQAIINKAIDAFKLVEPHVTVNNVKQQGSYDDLKTMVVNGFAVDNYPDIAAAYPDAVSDFILNAKALNIEPYMLDEEIGWTEEDFDDIPEAYIEMGQQYIIPGTYSLPASKSTEALYYNQDVLIGLNLSGVDATINDGKPLNEAYFNSLTWEELFEKLVPALDAYDQSLDSKSKIIDRTTYADWAWVGYDSDDNFFITLAEQYGYGYTGIDQITGNGKILFNNDDMKGLMKKFVGYYNNHYFTTKGVIKENVNYRSTKDAMLFSIGSTGGVKYQFDDKNPHNVGVAPLPYGATGQRKIISQGPDLAFLNHKNENRSKATWLFYKFFTNTDFNCEWAINSGYSPIRYSVLETEDYAKYADTNQPDQTLDRLCAYNAQYAATVGDYLFTSPVFKGSSEARNQVGTIFAACAAAADLDAEIDGIFQTAEDNTRLKM